MQVVAQLLNHFLGIRGTKANIIVETSGDTGPAAVAGVQVSTHMTRTTDGGGSSPPISLTVRRGSAHPLTHGCCGTSGRWSLARDTQGCPHVEIFCLYPHNRVSPVQELQLTTVAAPNVHVYRTEGNTDEQAEVLKSIFMDEVLSWLRLDFDLDHPSRTIKQTAARHLASIYTTGVVILVNM